MLGHKKFASEYRPAQSKLSDEWGGMLGSESFLSHTHTQTQQPKIGGRKNFQWQ